MIIVRQQTDCSFIISEHSLSWSRLVTNYLIIKWIFVVSDLSSNVELYDFQKTKIKDFSFRVALSPSVLRVAMIANISVENDTRLLTSDFQTKIKGFSINFFHPSESATNNLI